MRPWRLFAVVFAFAVVTAVIGGLVMVSQAMVGLPNVRQIPALAGSTQVFDRYGHLVTVLHRGMESQPVPLSQIPTSLQQAIIATEDASFETNPGFDVKGLARSAIADLTGHGQLQGASTITEQLGKMIYLEDNGSVSYKVKEILLGIRLAQTYSKRQILDMYLNRLYLGDGAVGVEAASEAYFGKPVSRLDLVQSALLAGLPQAPSAYDPLVYPKAALARRNEVLTRMASVGDLTAAQAQKAATAPLELAPGGGVQSLYPDPWFVDAVISTLGQDGFSGNQIFSGNLRVYTTLDPSVQADAERAVADVMNGLPGGRSGPEAAVAVMNPATGDVLALVGGRHHPPGYQTVLNLATQSHFQTGSSIKPLAEYPTALMHGDTAYTVVDDVPWLKVHGQWWPQNDNGKYMGRLPLIDALAISDNNVAVKLELSRQAGILRSWETAVHVFGLPLVPQDQNAALGIGGLTRGVSPLDMAAAYATFATGGSRPVPRIVREVKSLDGTVLFRQSIDVHPVLSPQITAVMTHMMEAVIDQPGGTGYGVADIGRPAAGKTGTSSGGENGWFIGYTPQLVTAVWEGHIDPVPQPGVFGATYAAPMWRLTMEAALRDQPVENFRMPPGLVQASVDMKSGLLPSPLTPPQYVATGTFIAGTEPTRISDVWVLKNVDALDPHRLWTPGCSAPSVTKVLLRPPQHLVAGAPLPEDSTLWAPTLVCGGGGGGVLPGNPQMPTGTGSLGPSQAATLTVFGGAATPADVSLQQGASVTIHVINRDPAPYVFSDPSLGLEEAIPPAGNVQFTFTAGTVGAHPFVIVGGAGGGNLAVVPPSTNAPPSPNPSPGPPPQPLQTHVPPGQGGTPPGLGGNPPSGSPQANLP